MAGAQPGRKGRATGGGGGGQGARRGGVRQVPGGPVPSRPRPRCRSRPAPPVPVPVPVPVPPAPPSELGARGCAESAGRIPAGAGSAGAAGRQAGGRAGGRQAPETGSRCSGLYLQARPSYRHPRSGRDPRAAGTGEGCGVGPSPRSLAGGVSVGPLPDLLQQPPDPLLQRLQSRRLRRHRPLVGPEVLLQLCGRGARSGCSPPPCHRPAPPLGH